MKAVKFEFDAAGNRYLMAASYEATFVGPDPENGANHDDVMISVPGVGEVVASEMPDDELDTFLFVSDDIANLWSLVYDMDDVVQEQVHRGFEANRLEVTEEHVEGVKSDG